MTVPCAPIRTGRREPALSHSTIPPQKPSAMCWATSTGAGKSAGRPERMAASARGPPVEAAMATAPFTASADGVPACRTAVSRGFLSRRIWVMTLTPARSRTFLVNWAAPDLAPGFSITSSAPLASAAKAVSASSRAASTRIGTGRVVMICSMTPSPPMPGSSISMVTRSGRSSPAILTASTPLPASPASSMPASVASWATITLRAAEEPSTTSTLTGLVGEALLTARPPPRPRRRPGHPWPG